MAKAKTLPLTAERLVCHLSKLVFDWCEKPDRVEVEYCVIKFKTDRGLTRVSSHEKRLIEEYKKQGRFNHV